MQLALTQKSVVRSLFWGIDRPSLLRSVALVALGSVLIAIGAKITVPLQPVPVTLQSLAVLFIAMTYGFRLGIATVSAYLVAGLSGLPVFAIGSLGMTSGYLLGLWIAAALTGFLAEHGWARHILSTVISVLLGSLLILFFGWLVLSHFVGVSAAFALGVKPFILGDSLKIIFLACVVPSFWRSVK